MRISLIVNNFYYQKPKNVFVDKCCKSDSISFSSKSTVKSRILNLPEEAFLSNEFRQYILLNLNDKNILDLHLAYYQDLLMCKTLDEAKEKYPEFQNVLEADEINPKEQGVERYYRKIKKEQIEGIDFENLTLELLKVLYARAKSPFEIGENKILGMGRKTLDRLILALNIPYDKRYFDIISIQKNANLTSISWQNEERKEGMSQKIRASWQDEEKKELASKRSLERWQDPEFRQETTRKIKAGLNDPEVKERKSAQMKALWADEEKRGQISNAIRETLNSPDVKQKIIEERKQRSENPSYIEKLSKASKARWQDENYRKKIIEARRKAFEDPLYREKKSKAMIERWQNPEYREKMIQAKKAQWQDADYIDLMAIVVLANSKAWDIHPNARVFYQEVSKGYPRIGAIAQKRKKGIPLTSEEEALRKLYFKECHVKYPELSKEIGIIQKELLAQWGFYNKDRNINEILNNIMSQDWDSIEDIL